PRRGSQRRGRLVVLRAESDGRGLALLQGPDDAVQSRDLSHGSLLPRSGDLVLQAAVDAAGVALEDLVSVFVAESQRVDVALGVVVIVAGLRIDAADRADHLGG